jgi:hypothetical protein
MSDEVIYAPPQHLRGRESIPLAPRHGWRCLKLSENRVRLRNGSSSSLTKLGLLKVSDDAV